MTKIILSNGDGDHFELDAIHFEPPIMKNTEDRSMEAVRHSSQARLNHIAENISAGKYDLLPNCQAIVDNMRGIRVQSDGGFMVGVSVDFIDDNPIPSILAHIRDQIDEWEAFSVLLATEPMTPVRQ